MRIATLSPNDDLKNLRKPAPEGARRVAPRGLRRPRRLGADSGEGGAVTPSPAGVVGG